MNGYGEGGEGNNVIRNNVQSFVWYHIMTGGEKLIVAT